MDGQTPVGSGCGHTASPRPSDSAPKANSLTIKALPLVKLSSLTHTKVGANGLLTQVQPKSRSVGLPSEANSHLPESELRGARRPFPRGKIEKLINLKKVRQKVGSDSDD